MADTTLTADITAGVLILPVAAALSADTEGDFLVQIGEEFLLVERRGMRTNPQVKRVVFGTTAAAHSEDDDVILVVPAVQTGDPATPSAALPFGVDGDGNLIFTGATADPVVTGAVFSDSGVLTVSEGA